MPASSAKTLASAGQSNCISGYALGSDSNLTNNGVTLNNRSTVGAAAAQSDVLIFSTGNTVVTNGPSERNARQYLSARVAFHRGGNNVLMNQQGVRIWSMMGGELSRGATPRHGTNLDKPKSGGSIQLPPRTATSAQGSTIKRMERGSR
jgi:hypothetical protein